LSVVWFSWTMIITCLTVPGGGIDIASLLLHSESSRLHCPHPISIGSTIPSKPQDVGYRGQVCHLPIWCAQTPLLKLSPITEPRCFRSLPGNSSRPLLGQQHCTWRHAPPCPPERVTPAPASRSASSRISLPRALQGSVEAGSSTTTATRPLRRRELGLS
jgi:hypothetical protein